MYLKETNSTVTGVAGNKTNDGLKLNIGEREHSFNWLLEQIEAPGIFLFSVVLRWKERSKMLNVFGHPAISKGVNKDI